MSASPHQRFKIAYVDVDNVLLKYTISLGEFVAEKFPELPIPVPFCEGLYKNYVPSFGPNQHRYREVIQAFNSSPLFGKLNPYPDAQEVLPEMKKDGWIFVAITHINPDSPEVIRARNQNLETIFGKGFIQRIHCLGFPKHKETLLKAYKSGVWIEDFPLNAVQGAEAGHTTFLLDRTHNHCEHPEVIRVPCWRAIQKHLQEKDNQYIPVPRGHGLMRTRS
jgi:hypothetical protein